MYTKEQVDGIVAGHLANLRTDIAVIASKQTESTMTHYGYTLACRDIVSAINDRIDQLLGDGDA